MAELENGYKATHPHDTTLGGHNHPRDTTLGNHAVAGTGDYNDGTGGYNNGTGHGLANGTGLRRTSNIANPATLGLFSFASTTFLLSMYLVSARGINVHNAIIGMALFCGGLAQLLAGMWEFPKGNTFGATVFTMYGAFWLSYAAILIPGSGVMAAYEGREDEFGNAIGIYFFTWFIVTFMFFIVSLRKNIGFIAMFAFFSLTFILLGTGNFTSRRGIRIAGGATGLVTSFIAFYLGLSELLGSERRPLMRAPVGLLGVKHRAGVDTRDTRDTSRVV
jgi:uncharacterized protein